MKLTECRFTVLLLYSLLIRCVALLSQLKSSSSSKSNRSRGWYVSPGKRSKHQTSFCLIITIGSREWRSFEAVLSAAITLHHATALLQQLTRRSRQRHWSSCVVDRHAGTDRDNSQRAVKRPKRKACARVQPNNRRDSIAALAESKEHNKEQHETLFTAAQKHFGEGTHYTPVLLQELQLNITEHNISQMMTNRNILAMNEMTRCMQQASAVQ